MVCRLVADVLMQKPAVFGQHLLGGKSEMGLPVICCFDRKNRPVSTTIEATGRKIALHYSALSAKERNVEHLFFGNFNFSALQFCNSAILQFHGKRLGKSSTQILLSPKIGDSS